MHADSSQEDMSSTPPVSQDGSSNDDVAEMQLSSSPPASSHSNNSTSSSSTSDDTTSSTSSDSSESSESSSSKKPKKKPDNLHLPLSSSSDSNKSSSTLSPREIYSPIIDSAISRGVPSPPPMSPHKRSTSFSRLPIKPPKALALDYAVQSIQGKRKTQEDAHSAVPVMGEHTPESDLPFAFFGVYDGHGGDKASEFVCQRLHVRFLEHVEKRGSQSTENLKAALHDAFLDIEEEFMQGAKASKECSGTTAAVIVVKDNEMIVGNVGDTEIVLCETGNKATMLTEVHNPKRNPEEVERVKSEGGVIYSNRVGHPVFNPQIMSIAVSRAIGDYGFKAGEFTGGKPSGLSAEPYVASLTLSPRQHHFCVIACDGVWDVMSGQDVVDFVAARLPPGGTQTANGSSKLAQDIANELVEEAYARGSTDNISALLVVFNWNVTSGNGGSDEGDSKKSAMIEESTNSDASA